MRRSIATAWILILTFSNTIGYIPAGNWPYVKASEGGIAYLRSVPSDSQLWDKGWTYVYLVKKLRDQLVARFRWYSRYVYIEAQDEGTVSTVRVLYEYGREEYAGPYIEFYLNAKLVKVYTLPELVKRAGVNLQDLLKSGSSQDLPIGIGNPTFQWILNKSCEFHITLQHQVEYRFDTKTGELLSIQGMPRK